MLTALYSFSLLVSAFLLFSIQPLFTKMALPLLGGSAVVWTTAQVFFPATLFLGYVYAYGLTRWLPRKTQVLVHLATIALAVAVVPIGIGPDVGPPLTANPLFWFLGLLSLSVGLPFFAVATTAPLLQRWCGYMLGANTDPYFLYAASNLGGLLALVGYPVFIEPALGLTEQSFAWGVAYAGLVVLIGVLGFQLLRGGSARVESRDPAADPGDKPPLALGLRWLLLAFVPSALLLNVTLHINTDVATSPVFWVVPLSLYLLSFVVVFSRRQLVRHHRTLALQPIGLVVLTMCFSTGQLLLNVIVHLSAFFLIALTCHGALAKSRPGVRYLTQFYLWLSFGGLLGGVFAGVVAPLVFDSLLEYPLMLALACVLGSKFIPGFSKDAFWDVVLALGLGGLFLIQDYYTRSLRFDPGVFGETAVATVFGLILYSFRKRPYRLGLGIVAILLPAQLLLGDQALEQKRSFYGVHRVLTDGHYQILTHGTTIHGAEHRLAARQREPLTYYYSGGPLGQMFERVGIVGLGAGSIACYRQSTQARYTFFEIDPVVVEIATNPAFFRFLSLCGNNVEVVLGDGRRSLSLIEDDTFDLLILDAFSSDAIPTHLLTREALSLYIRKLSPQGVLMIHLSNRNLNLEPVLAALVEDANLSSLIQHHEPPEGGDPYWWKSTWAVVGRTLHDIELLGADHRWQPLASRAHRRPWTDDYSNVLGAIDWGASFGSRSD